MSWSTLQVSGFDSVDDESKPESSQFDDDSPAADEWIGPDNPSFAYYMYYMFANIVLLNDLRRSEPFDRAHCCRMGTAIKFPVPDRHL